MGVGVLKLVDSLDDFFSREHRRSSDKVLLIMIHRDF